MAEIILADGEKAVGLAMMLKDLLLQNLQQKPEKLKDFEALDKSIAINAPDIEVSITLIFEKGKLTIHNGIVGEPDLVITANSDAIMELNLINIKLGMPWYFDATGRKVIKMMFSGELKVERMFRHLPTLTRFTKIMSIS